MSFLYFFYQLGPQRGVEQSMTVVISFHDTFITKVDRAYRYVTFGWLIY